MSDELRAASLANVAALDASVNRLNAQLSRIANIDPHACLAGALVLQAYAMQNAPVDTGFLRSSMESVEVDNGAEMRVHAEYAIYQEYGTRYMAAHPYVRPAIDEHTPEIVKAIGNEIEKQIKSKA